MSQVLEPNVIVLFCRRCKKSTKHDTIIKDLTTEEWRKPHRAIPLMCFNGSRVYRFRKCRECGEIVKF